MALHSSRTSFSSSSPILRIAPLARAGSANASNAILVARSRSSSGYFFCPTTVNPPCHHCPHQTQGDSQASPLSSPATPAAPSCATRPATPGATFCLTASDTSRPYRLHRHTAPASCPPQSCLAPGKARPPRGDTRQAVTPTCHNPTHNTGKDAAKPHSTSQ